jgi:hypothetical protein
MENDIKIKDGLIWMLKKEFVAYFKEISQNVPASSK